MTVESASRYPVLTHWMDDSVVSNSRPRVSIATITIVVSRIDMMMPRTTTAAIRRKAGSMAGGWADAGWVPTGWAAAEPVGPGRGDDAELTRCLSNDCEGSGEPRVLPGR